MASGWKVFSSDLELIQKSKDIGTYKPRMSATPFKYLLRDSNLERSFILSSSDYPSVAYLEVPEWEDNHNLISVLGIETREHERN
jgi:hypothetical protein